MNDFHRYLKTLRLQRGLSIVEVSQALDISRSLIYQYEANRTFPNGKNLIKLARFFHISLDELFGIVRQKENTIPLYNAQGHPIWLQDFPFSKACAYYLLSEGHLVLVSYQKHYRTSQLVLGWHQKQLTIFQITNHQHQFFLLDKKGQLYPFHDNKLQIIGIIIQFIQLYPQD